jgi:hypothetical protein
MKKGAQLALPSLKTTESRQDHKERQDTKRKRFFFALGSLLHLLAELIVTADRNRLE